MVPLNVAATWTRMLSVTAGACAAAGAPGPGTRVRGRPALEWLPGPWLGLLDCDGLRRPERQVLEPWLLGHAEPLLLVRHVLLARPLAEDIFIELTPQALEAMPHGWRERPRPILILPPAGRTRPARRDEYLDALSRLRIPLLAKINVVLPMRAFGPGFIATLAHLRVTLHLAAFLPTIHPTLTALARRISPAARAVSLRCCPPICSASSKPRSFSAAHELVRRNRRNAARGKRPHRGRDRASRARRWSRPRLLAADHLAVGAGPRGAPLERPLAPAPAGAARRGDRRAPPAPALRARRMLLGAAAVAAQLDGRAPSGAGPALRERPHLAGGAGAAGGRAGRPADDDRRRPARARQAARPGAPSAIRGVAGAVGGSESGVRQGAGRVARPGTAVDHHRALAALARAGRMAAARLQGLPPRRRADRAVRRARSAGRLLRARDAGGGRDRRRVHLAGARTRNPAGSGAARSRRVHVRRGQVLRRRAR